MLDALDEISSQAMRNKIRDEIDIFCEIYYLNKFIISTREAGYLKNKFDESFIHLKINEFDDNQVKSYCKNWFCSFYSKKEFKDFWDKFMLEVKRAKCINLIRNPIILILALIIFDIEKNLPSRRVEFYKKCIETFLTVREDGKTAFILSDKSKSILGIELILPRIAFYKFEHTKENEEYKFNYDEFKKSILQATEVNDIINWIEPVNQYAQYIIKRTELIYEKDENVLDFAHKTFNEYFLAIYYTKQLENEELFKLLIDWIGDSNNDELARLVIEVIIQNGDPRQINYIMNYLFDWLDKDFSNNKNLENKKVEIFTILASLYDMNILHPKYHEKYYRCLLYHPEYTEKVYQITKIRENSDFKVNYDCNILAQLYCDIIKDNNEFLKTLNSLFYLSNEFKDSVNKIEMDINLKHIIYLLTWAYHTKNDYRKVETPNKDEILYFLNDGLESTLNYPQIYIAVVEALIVMDKQEGLEKLIDFKFEENSLFTNYMAPNNLYAFVKRTRDSYDYFLVFLIIIVQCGRNKTNLGLGYIIDCNFKNKKKGKIDNANDQNVENGYWIWDILNNTIDFEAFKIKLVTEKVYNNDYGKLYFKFYNDYNQREKHNEDRRILKFERQRELIENQKYEADILEIIL